MVCTDQDRGADLLLAHGYFLGEDAREQQVMKPYPPLGLLYLSSHLKSKSIRVEVFDSTFSNLDDFQQRLTVRAPRVVGIYSNLMTKRNVLRMMEICQQHGVPTLLGGPDPAPHAREYLDHGATAVVRGEGELTLEKSIPLIVDAGVEKLAGLPGVVMLDASGHLIDGGPGPSIPDLSAQPWPDREAIDVDAYLEAWRLHHGTSSLSLITARGCPFTCAWCSHSVYGRSYRRRSAADVADEIEWIVHRYSPDQLWFADDVFTLDRRFVLALATEFERRSLRVPFECISRADCLDQELIRALVRLGCWRLWIGSESGSQRILNQMARRTKVEDVRQKAKMLKAAGIQVGMFIMLGYEGERIEDIRSTISHLTMSAPDVFLTTVAYPIKGTDYYKRVAHRIRSGVPWAEGTDRDLCIEGRHSARYYQNVVRWIEGRVELERAKREDRFSLLRRARPWSKSLRGRVGMVLSKRETEKVASDGGWPAKDRAGKGW